MDIIPKNIEIGDLVSFGVKGYPSVFLGEVEKVKHGKIYFSPGTTGRLINSNPSRVDKYSWYIYTFEVSQIKRISKVNEDEIIYDLYYAQKWV